MVTNEELSKEERIEYWEMVLDDFKQSGLNKTSYCQNNDIPVSTLNYWINRMKDIRTSQDAACERFVELPVPEGNSKVIHYSSNESYCFEPEIILEIGDMKISLNSSTPMPLLSNVLKEIAHVK